MKILGGLAIFFQEWAIERVVDLQKREVLEVFSQAFNGEGFFSKGSVTNFMAPAGNPFLISSLRINLTKPSYIPVTCGSK